MAEGWMKSVLSDMVAEVGWNPDTEELLVHFKKNGKTAAYKGFDRRQPTNCGARRRSARCF